MNFMFWNLRGIANGSTLSRMHKLVYNNSVCFLAIIEPMIDSSRITGFRLSLGFDNACSNLNGNIWVFWKEPLDCIVIQNLDQCISLKYNHGVIERDFFVTAIYSKYNRIDRLQLWAEL